jgi:hypothetical protein
LLVLDIYDLVKGAKRAGRVEKRLDAKDEARPHPCDMATKDYGVINHKVGIVKEVQFRINATSLTTKNNILSETKLPEFEPQKPLVVDSQEGNGGVFYLHRPAEEAPEVPAEKQPIVKKVTRVSTVTQPIVELPSQESDRAPPASKADNNFKDVEPEAMNENKGDKMGQEIASQPCESKKEEQQVEVAPKPRTSLQE